MPSQEQEINILLDAIKRLAKDPSKPNEARYGDLVRDDRVANQLEALVGTLRAARKQKKVDYKGEMLFQGVHDDVIVSIVE